MLLFHRTSANRASAILADGFMDGEGNYLTLHTYRGVWLSDSPLDENEGAFGDTVLAVEIPEDLIAEYEWIEELKPYREFLIPASVVNEYGPARVVEVEDLPGWWPREKP